ncbi:MAG: hypothetical protein DHS20C16_36780 [Phycisphaerae bacterium]|nr:MAG: hypothetical protein DHS20C16_36780 [Phycisphaerae bacterium]
MQALTFAIAAAGALLALRGRSVHALGAYLIVLCWYPQFLTIPLGTFDFPTGRFVILVVLMRLMLTPGASSSFKINWLDVFIVLAFICRFIAFTVNAPFDKVFVREMGMFFDTVLVYFAGRLAIRSQDDFIVLAKTLVMIGTPLAIFGFYQSWTGHNPFGWMRAYDAWDPHEQRINNRVGWFRADVVFNLHISFGMFFSMVFALAAGIWPHTQWRPWMKAGAMFLMFIGVFSSMSSAPLFSIVASLGILILYPVRRHWFYFLIIAVAFGTAVEFYSNRHLPHVLGRLAFSSKNVYYRTELYAECFGGGMKDHWTYGYGYVGVGPGTDNSNFHWKHKDLLSIYISRLVRTGLVGLTPFFIATILPYFAIRRAFTRASTEEDRWFIWCFMAGLGGWHIALMTVNILHQIVPLYFMMMGIATNLPSFYERKLPEWLQTPRIPAGQPQRAV